MPQLLEARTDATSLNIFCDFHDHAHDLLAADVERLIYAQIAAAAIVQSGRDLRAVKLGWPCPYWLLAQADQDGSEIHEYVRATVEARTGDGC